MLLSLPLHRSYSVSPCTSLTQSPLAPVLLSLPLHQSYLVSPCTNLCSSVTHSPLAPVLLSLPLHQCYSVSPCTSVTQSPLAPVLLSLPLRCKSVITCVVGVSCLRRRSDFTAKLQDSLGEGFQDFKSRDSPGKSSFVLGSEFWEETFHHSLSLLRGIFGS